MIFPIIASLIATALGSLATLLYNRKRSADKVANAIDSLTNQITAVEGEMKNGFERVALEFERAALEKDTVLNAFTSAKTEMEQTNQAAALKQGKSYQDIIQKLQELHHETVELENFKQTIIESIGNMEQDVSKNSNLIETTLDILRGNVERNINPSRSGG